MTYKPWILVIMAFAWLALTADSCILQSTDIEVPLHGSVDMPFHSVGTSDMGDTLINFNDELADLEDDAGSEIDTLVSLSIENILWRLVTNDGDPSTAASATVNVTRVSTNVTELAASFSMVSIDSVGTEFVPALTNQAGIELLTDGFDEYVAYRNGMGPEPDLRYRFSWSSSGSPAPVDFHWEVRVKFTLVGVFEVEVPDLFD